DGTSHLLIHRAMLSMCRGLVAAGLRTATTRVLPPDLPKTLKRVIGVYVASCFLDSRDQCLLSELSPATDSALAVSNVRCRSSVPVSRTPGVLMKICQSTTSVN